MKWFRFYHEFIDDPKIAMMSDSDQLLWVKVLCLANDSKKRGCILLSDEEICWKLRITMETWKHAVDKFRAKGMIEHCNEGYKVVNWDKRQFESDDVNKRVAKNRAKNKPKEKPCNVTSNVSVTLHATAPDPDPDPDPEIPPLTPLENEDEEEGGEEESFNPNNSEPKPDRPDQPCLSESEPETHIPVKSSGSEMSQSSAAAFLSQKNKLEQFEARMRGEVYPWRSAGRIPDEFAEFVGKQFSKSEMHPKTKGRNHVVNCENSGDVEKVFGYWEEYQQFLSRKAAESEQPKPRSFFDYKLNPEGFARAKKMILEAQRAQEVVNGR